MSRMLGGLVDKEVADVSGTVVAPGAGGGNNGGSAVCLEEDC